MGGGGYDIFGKEVPEYASALFEYLAGTPEWLRCGGCPVVSVSLPYAWAAFLSHKVIKDFCILNKFPCARQNWFGWREINSLLGHNHARAFINTEWQERFKKDPVTPISLDGYLLEANRLREMASLDLQIEEKTQLYRLAAALDGARVKALCEEWAQKSRERKVTQVILSDMLRSSADLRQVLVLAATVLLSPETRETVLAQLRETPVHNKGRLSQNRFEIDCALMLMWRDRIRSLLAGKGAVFHFATDSSPQFHRDYQITLLLAIKREKLRDMIIASDTLDKAFQKGGPKTQFNHASGVAESVSKSMDAQEVISDGLVYHMLPATVLAQGRTGLRFKWQRMFWSLRLVTWTNREMCQVISSGLGYLSDSGTEKGVKRVKPTVAGDAFPQFQDTGPKFTDRPAPSEDDWPDDTVEYEMNFDSWLDVSGPSHIVHGCVEALSTVMEHYDDTLEKLTHVARLIFHPDTRDRLFRTCFTSRTGEALAEKIKEFDASVQPGRWGTVADCVMQLQDVELAVRWGWDLEKYLEGKKFKPKKVGDGESYKPVRLETVDAAIQSEFFWGMIHILSVLGKVLNTFFARIDGCTCCWELLKDFANEVDADIVAMWRKCPNRGFNGHWFASGECFDDLSSLFDMASAVVEAGLPSKLSERERCTCVAEFESGRSHIICTMLLKNQYMLQPPFRALAMSHPRKAMAVLAWQDCLASDDKHPVIQSLKSDVMVRQAEVFFGTDTPDDAQEVELFQEYRGSLRWVRTADKCCEGVHARFHKRGKAAPNHSVRYMNFTTRVKELKEEIKADPHVLMQIAQEVAHVGPLTLVQKLGLGRHPIVAAEVARTRRSDRSAGIMECPYLADAHSQREMPPPILEVAAPPVGARAMIDVQSSSKVEGLFHRYAMEHMIKFVFPLHIDAYYSLPVVSSCINLLCSLLANADADGFEAKVNLKDFTPNAEHLKLPEGVGNHVFFQPVSVTLRGSSADNAKRRKVEGEQGLLDTDVHISLHQVLRVDRANRTMVLATAPMGKWDDIKRKAFTLDVRAVPFDKLEQVLRWKPTFEVEHYVEMDEVKAIMRTNEVFEVDVFESKVSDVHLETMMSVLCAAGRK